MSKRGGEDGEKANEARLTDGGGTIRLLALLTMVAPLRRGIRRAVSGTESDGGKAGQRRRETLTAGPG